MLMASTGKTFKWCGCRNSRGQRLDQTCPRLAGREHGTWYFHCSAPNLFGRSEPWVTDSSGHRIGVTIPRWPS
jgi:hypothetical protein